MPRWCKECGRLFIFGIDYNNYGGKGTIMIAGKCPGCGHMFNEEQTYVQEV